MLSPVSRMGAPRLCCILCLTFLLVIISGLFPPTSAAAFTARALGDLNQVAVVEVSGNFDALDASGQINMEPRRALAREFYRSHGDDYDFLVIFTNFEVRMPSIQARAFFSPARNNVQGIGLPLYDYTEAYSADGLPLERLEGTIDMGNLAAHVLEPADPRFETTLRILTHEMLHRWGAYLRFLDAGSESAALLGMDKAHWSFLHDSGGSTLYGNRWQENGDGTYTALSPESAHPGELFGRLLNPLELYLMGFAEAETVPPLQLIDAPGIDPAQLPAPGVTIPGMLRTVSIDDIIALEGPRIPAVAESRKELRMGFVLAVAPGTFDAGAASTLDALAAIGRLRGEWEKRFTILTDGQGAVRTGLVQALPVEANPPVQEDSGGAAPAASLDAGVSWLVAQQLADGRWQDQPGTALRDTSEAIKALSAFPSAASAVVRGRQWLQQEQAANHDFHARQLQVHAVGGCERLLAEVNADGGWGANHGFPSNPLDTAIALQALAINGIDGPPVAAACAYLHGSQQADGGWHAGSGPSQLQTTCAALLAINPQRHVLPLEASVAEAGNWVLAAGNGDGGFGRPSSNAVDSALALLALKSIGSPPTATLPALNWLLEHQAVNGSWQGHAYTTALAVQALYALQVAPDLAVSEADILFDPPLLTDIPGEVAVIVTVRNLGREPVSAASLALYAGDPAAAGVLLGERQVAVPGNASVQATFAVPVSSAGVHRFYVFVDPRREIAESDEWNNSGSRSLTAALPPPTIGFTTTTASMAEGGGTFSLPVALSHPWHEAVSVDCVAGEGGNAVAGVDYRLLSGTISIPPGETSATVSIRLLDDLIAEADKTFSVVLSSASTGTIGQASQQLLILDDEPPAIAITSPPGKTLGDSTPTLLFTSTAGIVQVRVDGSLVATRSGEPLGPLADGAHQLEVVAINSLGGSSRQQVDFSIDTTLPVVTILSPAAGLTNEPAPLLTYTVSGDRACRVTLDGKELAKSSGERLDPLADGEHVLVVTAWNEAGTEASLEVRFVVDATPPGVEIVYPDNDVLRETTPLLFCRLEGAASTSVRLDDAPTGKKCGEHLGPLTDGAHTVEVTAVDEAGNRSTQKAAFVVASGVEPAYATASGWPLNAARFYGGMAVDPFGNVYLATQDAGYSLTIQKYTSQGVPVWQRRPFAVTLIPEDLAVDQAGNLFVVGYNSSGDGFLYKFAAADGAYLAGHSFVTAGSDFAFAVQVGSDGEVVVAGETGGDLYGAPNGTMNIWIARFDNNCRHLEGRQLTLSGTQELAGRGSLALDEDGYAYLAGYTNTATFGPASGGNDAFVVKFSRSLWPLAPSLQFGTAGDDRAHDVVVDVYGNIYVGGVSVETSYYFEKGFVYKFDAAGNLLGQVTLGTQPITALACERDGTLYVMNELGALGKYDRDLALLWTSGLGWNYRYRLAKDPFGDLYAAGDGGTLGGYASVIKLTDTRRPSVTLDVAQLQTRHCTVTLGGTLTGGATIDLVNPELSRLEAVSYSPSGRWQMNVAGLPEGLTTVVLEATAPNGFTRQVKAKVIVDVIPPQVVINAPVDAQRCSVRTPLEYTVSDGQVEVLVNGVSLYKASGQLLDALRAGWNTVRVEATDAAGNVGFAAITIYAEGDAVGEMPLSQVACSQPGTAGDESAVAVARDSGGNLYLMGYTTGSFPGYLNAGGRDPYIAKFDPAGRHLVTWQLGSPFDESGGGFAVDANGNLLVTWNVHYVYSKGQVDFAVRLVKISGEGALLWQTELNSTASDQVYDLVLAPNGEVLIAGETYGSLDKQRYGGAGDYFLAKFSAAGTRQWTRLSNSADSEALYALAVDAAGVIYGAVHAGSALAGVPVPGHVALLKFDAAGNLLKVDPVVLPGSDFFPRELLLDGQGRLLTAGGNGTRYFLAAHDKELSRQWLEVSPVDDSLAFSALTVDPTGNLVVGGVVSAPFAGNRAFGGSDGVFIKHSSTGRRQWSLQYGSSGNDYVGGLVWGSGEELWVGGHTAGLLGESRIGLSDPYLARLTPPQPLFGPKLTIDPHAQFLKTTALQLTGTVTPGASMEIFSRAPGMAAAVFVASDGTWSASVSGLQPDSENLLTISAANELGVTSMEVVITVDTVPPQLTVDPPPNPIMMASHVLSGTVETGTALTLDVLAQRLVIPSVNGNWSCQVSGLQAGDNLLTVTATDAAGNVTAKEVVIRYTPPPPPILTVAPAVIGTLDATDILLSIGRVVPAGSTVAVSRILDLNGNGYAESEEPVTGYFTVTDGFVTTNPGLPADSDGARDGAIAVRLNGYFAGDRHHAAGEYLYVVTAGNGSAIAGFTVLAESTQQSISGTVRDQAGAPVAGALVELSDPWEHSYGFAHSDQNGDYRFDAIAPGDYLMSAEAPGYASLRRSPAAVRLVAGDRVSQDLTLLAGTYTVAGSVYDAATLQGLAGVVLRAISADYQAAAMTGPTGGYLLKLPAGTYQLLIAGTSGDGLAEAGYLDNRTALPDLTVTADAAGVDLAVDEATAFVCGQARTAAGVSVAGVPVEVSHAASGRFSQAVSDGEGRYCVGMDGRSGWTLGHPERLAFASGWLGSTGQNPDSVDMTVYPLDSRVGGVVTDAEGRSVAGVSVTVSHPAGPASAGKTSVAGRYLLGLASEPAGEWNLLVDGQDLGYPLLTGLLSVVPGTEMVRDFILQRPPLANTIVVTRASYDTRKKNLTVEATSNHPDAQLQVEGFGAMSYVRLFKGRYYWSLVRSVAVKPASVTVFGAEGRVTAAVQ